MGSPKARISSWIQMFVAALLLLEFTECQQQTSAPSLIIKPNYENVWLEGRDYMLSCIGNDDRTDLFSNLRWFGPQGEITLQGQGRLSILKDRPNSIYLTFQRPTAEDSGTYRCTGTFDNTKELTAEATVRFFPDITWEACPTNQSIVINKPGKIECSLSTNPGTAVSWSKDGKPLQNSERHVVTNEGVKIPSVSEADGGQYTVRAFVEDTGSIQTRNILVQVHVPPKIIEISPKVESTEGEVTELECKAHGRPAPTYQWLDEKQRDVSLLEGFHVNKNRGTLVIQNTRKEDEGIYVCWAENVAGKVSMELELIVMVRPTITKLNNITVEEHQTAIIECHATGNPLPQLSIRKEGSDAFTEGHSRVLVRQEERDGVQVLVLTIPSVVYSDDGLYYCSAENNAGLADKAGHIAVQYKPVVSTSATTVKTWTDNPVNLTCVARANPNATITWLFEGEDIDPNSPVYSVRPTLFGSNLVVKPLKEYVDAQAVYGVYTCLAGNRLGTNKIEITLQEASVPGPVTKANHVATATSVTFTFQGPSSDGGLPVKAYLVQYRPKDGGQTFKTKEWTAGVMPYILEGLRPRMSYEVKLAARNAVGPGPWSQQFTISTLAESAPEPPRILARDFTESPSPFEFELAWTLPAPNGRAIDYFELRYFEVVPDGQGGWKIVGQDSLVKITDFKGGPRYLLTDLLPDRTYKVEVRAHNEIGYSQDATIVFKTAKGGSHHGEQGGLVAPDVFPTQAIIAVSVFLIIVIIIVIDGISYVKCHCGILWSISSGLCGTSGSHTKASTLDDGKPMGKDTNGQLKPELNSNTDENDIPIRDLNNEELAPMLRGGINSSKNHVQSIPPKAAIPRDSAV